MKITKEQIREARLKNLYDFLLKHHPKQFTIEYDSLRMVGNHSMSIKEGYCGFQDWSNGDKGNSIDFLCKYLNYTFENAVTALLSDETIGYSKDCFEVIKDRGNVKTVEKTNEMPLFPDVCLDGGYSRYKEILVKHRGIEEYVLNHFDYSQLIYLGGRYNYDIVFKSKDNTWGEIWNYKNDYHGIVANSRVDGFFSFVIKNKDDDVSNKSLYICESSIDAISLLQYLYDDARHSAYYAGIGGAGKQRTINRLIGICHNYNIQPIIAFDNDDAGQLAYYRNKSVCSGFFPPEEYKDWNDAINNIKKKDYLPKDTVNSDEFDKL